MLHFRKISGDSEIAIVSQIAYKLFPTDYGAYVRQEHIQHFLVKYQSEDAIKTQLLAGSYYYLIREKGNVVGYLGFDISEEKLLLSKLYFNLDKRNCGFGSMAMEWLHEFAKEQKLNCIELLVLEENIRAITFYERQGFEFIENFEEHFYTGYSETNNRMRKLLRK